ncbi:MAG: hypothetical protein U5K71_14975 [Gracilimonas sp.]|nr:hypothetical protein [Gracilimonas sp.]
MNDIKTVLLSGLLLILFFQGCTDDSRLSKENDIVIAFAEEMLNPDDKVFARYRENIDIYKRLLDFPLSAQKIQTSFDWKNHSNNIEMLVSTIEIDEWNNQIEKYKPGKIEANIDTSRIEREFRSSGGYFSDDKFIPDPLNVKGKTYIISRPIVGNRFALIFYDLSYELNSLSGGGIILNLRNNEWVIIGTKTFVSTP